MGEVACRCEDKEGESTYNNSLMCGLLSSTDARHSAASAPGLMHNTAYRS